MLEILNQKNTYIDMSKDVPYVRFKTFDKYEESLIAGFSTRLGGVSKGHLSSLNLSFNRGDDRDAVLENHKRFAAALGYPYEKTVFSTQVHKTTIRQVTMEDAGKGIVKENDIIDTDGLITNVKGLPIMTFYADCIPLFFYDPVKEVIGMAHSGWRGTVLDIAHHMVERFKTIYGSDPADIIAAVGPGICKEDYEVDIICADHFIRKYNDEELKRIVFYKNEDKFHLDLKEACRTNLINSGIRQENITVSEYCTYHNSELFFSHRATNGMRGNLAGVMCLKG
ncbi:MAG: peptidoglycan editing factor PgeF [Eubacterium sp.]|nr:peptidoglycan editing factor PgeF [Eubacterium sp.]